MGRYDSSKTRVQPVFDALQQLPARDWLTDLWGMAALTRPNALRPPTTIGSFGAEKCYERALPPSTAFLRWMVQHPDRLNVLPGPGYGAKAGGAASQKRTQLFGADPQLREQARSEALKEIEAKGGAGSRKQWWAFEGFTHVDACFETDECLLLIEGKRTEAVSPSTRWFRERNQLWRNVEVAGELAKGRPFGVIVAVESEVDGRRALANAAATRDGSYPHLTQEQRQALDRHLLGFVVWSEIVSSMKLSVSLDADIPVTSKGAFDQPDYEDLALLLGGTDGVQRVAIMSTRSPASDRASVHLYHLQWAGLTNDMSETLKIMLSVGTGYIARKVVDVVGDLVKGYFERKQRDAPEKVIIFDSAGNAIKVVTVKKRR